MIPHVSSARGVQGYVSMSDLNEAMQILEPLTRPDHWQGECWVGDGSVRTLVVAALAQMGEVDAMMREIARATSAPASAEERAARAVDMAAAEMRNQHSTNWPSWIVELLESAQATVPEAEYRSALEALRERISARLDTESW